MPFPPRQGHVDSQRIWRLPVLKDGKVFLRSEEGNNPGFTVDLLLDGSSLAPALSGDYRSARLHSGPQSGYLRNSGPRQQLLQSARLYGRCGFSKDFSEKTRKKNFSITLLPAGIQDGLALRMAGKLLDTAPADRHLLILLTDTSPDGSRKILPTGKVIAQPAATMAKRACKTPQGGSCFAAAGRPGRYRLYRRRTPAPRCTDDLWTGSGPYPADGPAFHRCRKGNSFQEEIQELSG